MSLTPTIPLKGDLMKLEPQLISGASGRRSIHQTVGKWRIEAVDAVKSRLQNERCTHGGTALAPHIATDRVAESGHTVQEGARGVVKLLSNVSSW